MNGKLKTPLDCVYKTFNKFLLYRHILPVYSNHRIKRDPTLEETQTEFPLLFGRTFSFLPLSFFTKRGKPPGLPLGRFFLSAVLPYRNENVYKTFNSILLYRHNLPVYSNHQIKRDPTLEETQTEFPLLFGRTFSFLPLSFLQKRKSRPNPLGRLFRADLRRGAANHTHIKGMRRRGREAAPAPQEKK